MHLPGFDRSRTRSRRLSRKRAARKGLRGLTALESLEERVLLSATAESSAPILTALLTTHSAQSSTASSSAPKQSQVVGSASTSLAVSPSGYGIKAIDIDGSTTAAMRLLIPWSSAQPVAVQPVSSARMSATDRFSDMLSPQSLNLLQRLPTQTVVGVSGILSIDEVIDFYRIPIPSNTTLVVQLKMPQVPVDSLPPKLILIAPKDGGLIGQAVEVAGGSATLRSSLITGPSQVASEMYICVARSIAPVASDSANQVDSTSDSVFVKGDGSSAIDWIPQGGDSTSVVENGDDTAKVTTPVGGALTNLSYLLELIATSNVAPNLLPNSAGNIGIVGLAFPPASNSSTENRESSATTPLFASIGSGLSAASSRLVVDKITGMPDTPPRALPMRAGGPIGGMLSDGPSTRPVDLKDGLAIELARLLLDGSASQGSAALVPPSEFDVRGMISDSGSHVLQIVERMGNGVVLQGAIWPPLNSGSLRNNGLESVIEADSEVVAPEKMAMDEPLRSHSSSCTAQGQEQEEAEADGASSKKRSALRAGLGLAYVLAVTCLLPDLMVFFQERRARSWSWLLRIRPWRRFWPRLKARGRRR